MDNGQYRFRFRKNEDPEAIKYRLSLVGREISTFDDCEVIIKHWKHQRSNQQNRLYWLYVSAIRDHYNTHSDNYLTKDQVHKVLRDTFLEIDEIKMGSFHAYDSRSTTKLSKQEFADFMLQIEEYMSEIGIDIPVLDHYTGQEGN